MTGDPGLQVRTFQDREALSRAAADLFVSLSQSTIAAQGRFAVALSGGSTPKGLYTLLGAAPYREAVPWPRVHLFWSDERCVPQDHPESNYKLAYDAFLSKVSLPSENIHRIRGEEEPGKAARVYEDDLRRFFGGGVPVFDLLLLGAGEDGHTASLFPGSPSLHETTRVALPVYLERPKRDRVTLTLPVLNRAAHVLFLVSGRAKADVVSEIFEGGNVQRCPAGLVQPVNGDVLWLIDREAAVKLRKPVRT